MIANLAAQALQRLRLDEQTVEQAASLSKTLNDLEESYQATLLSLSAALDARDRETEGHSQRVTKLALAIGRRLELSEADLTNLERGALLHDVGKIGIPDNVLLKTGPLTPAERALMNEHPRLGHEMLRGISFLKDALPVVLYHQEMYDGSGYPSGLHGTEIPLAARIFAVADTYDAMTSMRPYREPLSHEQALAEIRRCSGTQFDPVVVAAFLSLFEEEQLANPARKASD
jgi:putative nucleotidyltransferase with HDIG domain